jgi:cell division protein FtsB
MLALVRRDGALSVERFSVAGTGRRRVKRRGPRIGRRRLRLVWAVAIVGAAVYLYYRPLSSYVETRSDLASRRAEVDSLRQERSALQLRLANFTSVKATEREARRLGYVHPGEQLFVVKGIDAWRRSQSPAAK